MALTIDGIPVSGSIGNKTFARNRAGAYTRRRTKPVNPNTALQVASRQAFAAAINVWTDDLTQLQRDAWETYAAGVTWLNKAGQPMQLTGQNAFVRVLSWWNYWFTTSPPQLGPPVSFDIGAIVPAVGGVSLQYDTSADTLTFTLSAEIFNNPWQVDGALVSVRVSQPMNASRNFRPNRFAGLGYAAVPETPTGSIAMGATASPWVYLAGQNVWVEIRAMGPTNALTEAIIVQADLTVVA